MGQSRSASDLRGLPAPDLASPAPGSVPAAAPAAGLRAARVQPSPPPSPVILHRIQFDESCGFAELFVACTGASARTDARIAARACALRPDLPAHTCKNSRGAQFGSVLADTPILHLFEHVVVDILTEDAALGRAPIPASGAFAAVTRYANAERTQAVIKVKYTEQHALLDAVARALETLAQITQP